MKIFENLPVHILTMVILCLILLDYQIVAGAVPIQNACLKCHLGLEPNLAQPALQWTKSVHAAVSICCEQCHGGDPNSPYEPGTRENGFIGVPSKKDIPSLCNSCHDDALYMRKYNIRTNEESLYKKSIHGQQLKMGNFDAASCVDCHGSHDIQGSDNPTSKINHRNIAATCARCHADSNRMKPYGMATDQFSQYKKSYHGQILYQGIKGKNPRLAPSCPGCHGIHAEKALKEAAQSCYNCHLITKRYFRKSIHSLLQNRKPQCIDCHGYHYIPYPDENLWKGEAPFHCGECHLPQSPEYQNGLRLRAMIRQARECAQETQDRVRQLRPDKNLDGLNLKMDEVFETLNKAITATHSQDVQIVSQLVQKVCNRAQAIDQRIDRRYSEIRQRKRWLGQALLLIALAFVLVAYQRSRLKNKD